MIESKSFCRRHRWKPLCLDSRIGLLATFYCSYCSFLRCRRGPGLPLARPGSLGRGADSLALAAEQREAGHPEQGLRAGGQVQPALQGCRNEYDGSWPGMLFLSKMFTLNQWLVPRSSSQNIVQTDPSKARQISLATAGTNFTKPGAHHLVLLLLLPSSSSPS